MEKIKHILTILAILGSAIFAATASGYGLSKFLPLWVSVWGVTAITSTAAYFAILLFEKSK